MIAVSMFKVGADSTCAFICRWYEVDKCFTLSDGKRTCRLYIYLVYILEVCIIIYVSIGTKYASDTAHACARSFL